ncbi:hypothetical protein QJS66_21765 [Kocuria rhizophila]|nr:hypothetical protein QJS66_21765 [Kocuria rhizophila]
MLLRNRGFQDAYQLDGGIVRYGEALRVLRPVDESSTLRPARQMQFSPGPGPGAVRAAAGGDTRRRQLRQPAVPAAVPGACETCTDTGATGARTAFQWPLTRQPVAPTVAASAPPQSRKTPP